MSLNPINIATKYLAFCGIVQLESIQAPLMKEGLWKDILCGPEGNTVNRVGDFLALLQCILEMDFEAAGHPFHFELCGIFEKMLVAVG